MNVVFDTSALMSLAAGKVLELAVLHCDALIPERVKSEVIGISQNINFEGNLAKDVLNYIEHEIQVIPSTKTSLRGEIECAHIANEIEEVDFLITDDIAALQELEKLCIKSVRFSTIIVYALFLKGAITKKHGLQIIERMRVQRNWKDNLIYEQAIILWDKLEQNDDDLFFQKENKK